MVGSDRILVVIVLVAVELMVVIEVVMEYSTHGQVSGLGMRGRAGVREQRHTREGGRVRGRAETPTLGTEGRTNYPSVRSPLLPLKIPPPRAAAA